MKDFHLPKKVLQFSSAISAIGGTTYVAGGSVRDHLLGIESKDIDLEIHNVKVEKLITIIQQFAPFKAVLGDYGWASKRYSISEAQPFLGSLTNEKLP